MHKNAEGQGAIAIHRWFAQGEGWSYHPWFQSRLQEFLTVIKPELEGRGEILPKSGGARMIECQALGGFLIGEQVFDPECPDPLAAGRCPTILRVAFLEARPEAGNDEKIRAELRQIPLPEKAGPDTGLKLAATSATIPAKLRRSSQPGRWRSRIGLPAVLLISLAALLALAISDWPFPQIGGKFRPLFLGEELPEEKAKMIQLLGKWDPEGKGGRSNHQKDVFQVAERFFEVLSKDEIKADWQDMDWEATHPDVKFVKPLPKFGAKPQDEKALRQELQSLLKRLTTEAKPPVDATSPQKSLVKLLEEIEQEMDYLEWWKQTGKDLKYATTATLNPKLAEYVQRFIGRNPEDKTNLSWQQPAAHRMYQELEKWNVKAVSKADTTERPWLVFHCYFQLLSQEHFDQAELKEDSYPAVFINLLPDKAPTRDGRFDNQDQFKTALRKLSDKLNVEASNNVETLVSDISKAMDYQAWKKGHPRLPYTEQGSHRVQAFVEQFSPDIQ